MHRRGNQYLWASYGIWLEQSFPKHARACSKRSVATVSTEPVQLPAAARREALWGFAMSIERRVELIKNVRVLVL